MNLTLPIWPVGILKWSTLLAIGCSAPAISQDYPHRDWGQVATLDMTVVDATACIAREQDRRGAVLVLPVEGGNDIDFSIDVAWGKKLDPWVRFKIRSIGDVTTLRVFYRRPYKSNRISKDIERLQKECLRVRNIGPT